MRWGIMDVDGREEEEAAINETHTCTVEGEGIKWTDTYERERDHQTDSHRRHPQVPDPVVVLDPRCVSTLPQ